MEKLKSKNYFKTPFYIACGHTDIAKLLLNDNRVDFNKTRNDGETPFSVACRWGHIEIVKVLLMIKELISIKQIKMMKHLDHLFILLVIMEKQKW
mgnify:CR=1 FL=1